MIHIIGNLGLLIMAVALFRVAFTDKRACIYGRTTLIYIGLFLLVFGIARTVVDFGIGQDEVVAFNHISATSIGTTLILLITLHCLQHKKAKRRIL